MLLRAYNIVVVRNPTTLKYRVGALWRHPYFSASCMLGAALYVAVSVWTVPPSSAIVGGLLGNAYTCRLWHTYTFAVDVSADPVVVTEFDERSSLGTRLDDAFAAGLKISQYTPRVERLGVFFPSTTVRSFSFSPDCHDLYDPSLSPQDCQRIHDAVVAKIAERKLRNWDLVVAGVDRQTTGNLIVRFADLLGIPFVILGIVKSFNVIDWLWAWRTRARSTPAGLCSRCSYDLRDIVPADGRVTCPECGASRPLAPAPKPSPSVPNGGGAEIAPSNQGGESSTSS